VLTENIACCVVSVADSLPYVEATILEVLRYKTLGALGLAHCTLRDTEVDGFFIPRQTTVSRITNYSGRALY